MQALRRRRAPVAGATLADELGVSLRTLYRDIAALKAQGAAIEGEAGLGYVLKPGFTLPPLMFTLEEIEALALGARWVEGRGRRGPRAGGAGRARQDRRRPAARARRSARLADPARGRRPGGRGGARRAAARAQGARRGAEARLRLCRQGRAATERVVWPVAVGFFDAVMMLAAWCETREAFRHFRLDRMAARRGPAPTARRRPGGACSRTGGGRRGSRGERSPDRLPFSIGRKIRRRSGTDFDSRPAR